MPDDWDVWMSGCRIIQDGRFLRRSPVQPSAQSRVGYGQTRLLRALSSRNPKGSQRHGLSWQFTPLPYSPLGGKVFPCTWSSLVYPCCLLSSLCAIEQPGSVTLMTSLLVGPSSEGRTCPVPTASPHWASALAPSQCLTDELAAVYRCPYWGFKKKVQNCKGDQQTVSRRDNRFPCSPSSGLVNDPGCSWPFFGARACCRLLCSLLPAQ